MVILLMLTLNTNQSVILEQNNMTFAILPIVTHIRTNEYQYLITSHMLCLIFSNNKNKLISLTILCKIKYFQKENCLIEFSHQIIKVCV
jgi:hypothetical protein